MKDKEFIPQISNVEILDYPVLAGSCNIGVKADVLGTGRITTISLSTEHCWRQTPDDRKDLVALCIAARAFRLELLRHFHMDHTKVQSASELMFHRWDATGRCVQGYPNEMLITDKKLFPGAEETEILFDVHDGFAVGRHDGREYVMFYPTMLEVGGSQAMQERIRSYVGMAVTDTGIIPADIALTMGQIRLVRPVQQVRADIPEPRTVRAVHHSTGYAADITDAALRSAGFTPAIDIPADGGRARKGLFLLDSDNRVTDFLPYGAVKSASGVDYSYRSLHVDKVADMRDLFMQWKSSLCATRIQDIHIRQAPGDPGRYFIGCAVDGERQLSRELRRSDASIWREIQRELRKPGCKPSYADYARSVSETLAVDYFKDAVLKERTLSSGLRR